jgi:hypothetical protein
MTGWRGLVFGAVVLSAWAAARAQNVGGPGKAVLELAREVAEGKDVAKKAAALKKQFRSNSAAMRLYNPRSRGGIGFGPGGEGIEARFVDLGEEGISPEALKKEAQELRRAARINLVLAEVVRGFAPQKPFQGRGRKEWERDLEAMKKASAGLLKALDSGSPREVRAAAARINDACNSCHDGKK